MSILRMTPEAFSSHQAWKTREAKSAPAPTPAPAPLGLYPLIQLCRDAGLPEPVPEYVFDARPHPLRRKWRFDFAWPLPQHKIGLEIDGGIWSNGRHTRGNGWLADAEKLNQAAVQGWRTLRYTPTQLLTAIADLRAIINA